jgi:Fe-S cluster assembly ATPase SufC
MNEIRKTQGQPELDAAEFLALCEGQNQAARTRRTICSSARSTKAFRAAKRSANEIFQMAVLEPKLAILDETDSGLDIDALKIVAQGVNKLKRARQRPACHHALSAAAELHRAGFCPRAGGRPHRENRRQGTRA